nr:glycosyltransferase 87 family protein [Pseudofrankia sp. EUN1h]
MTADEAVSPSLEDPMARGASELIGGPPGRHAVLPDRWTWWTPVRVLLALTIVVCGLGYAQKSTCRDTRNWTHEYQYTRMCYSDVVALYSQEGLKDGKVPYLDYPTEYPPLIGATMEVVAAVSRVAPSQRPVYRTENGDQVIDHWTIDARSALFYDLTALVFLCFACAAVVAVAKTAGRRRVWDAALFALAPTMVLHLLTNWDIVAVAFGALAVYAWSRRAPVAAGVLLGLGVATKLYPVFFLVAIGMLCLRTGQLRAFGRLVAATAATVAVVVLPTYLIAGYFIGDKKSHDGILSSLGSGGWFGMLDGHAGGAQNAVARFIDLNEHRPADWDSLAFAVQWLSGAYDPGWFGGPHLIVIALATFGLAAVAAGPLVRARWNESGDDEADDSAGVSTGASGASGAVRGATLAVGAAAWLVVVIATPVVLTAVRDHGISVSVLNALTSIALIASIAAIAGLCWFAPRRPRLPQVLFLLVVAFLVTNKVFSPQYTLWLLPLYALARPKWRAFLVWQAAEAYLLFMRFMHFIYNDTNGARGVARGWFVGAVALRDLVLLVLAGLVVREILRPELDVVRASGVDDPAGGVLDEAADAYGPHRRPARVLVGEVVDGPSSSGGLWADAATVADDRGQTDGGGAPGAPGGAAGPTGAPDGDVLEPGALFRPRRTDPEPQ